MTTKLLRWWGMGSPLWRRLALAAVLGAAAFLAAQVVALLGGSWPLPLCLASLTAAALIYFTLTLVMARARGEHAYSPGWYRRLQKSARAPQ